MNRKITARNIALAMGMAPGLATMAIPYLWVSPGTSDPYSPTVIMIVSAIQAKLGALGFASRKDGFVDKATSAALAQVSGKAWKSKSWMQIFGDILGATKRGEGPRQEVAMSNYIEMGALSRSTWCSPANPQGTCKPDAGTCKPMDPATLVIYKALQRATNRLLAVQKRSPIQVDGRIGSKTLAAVSRVSGQQFATCDVLAGKVDKVLGAMEIFILTLKAPQVADPRQTSRPSVIGPSNTVINPPTNKGIRELATSPIGLAVIGGGVLVILLATKPKRRSLAA